MSKKNSLEQKKVRREQRELDKQKQQAIFEEEVSRVKEVYIQLYKNDFKIKGHPFDENGIIKWLVGRIGETKVNEFIESVKVAVDLEKKESE